jgi:glycerol-3-phosphate dehydrogenase
MLKDRTFSSFCIGTLRANDMSSSLDKNDMHDICATLTDENNATLQLLERMDLRELGFDPHFDRIERVLRRHARWITSELYREIARRAGGDVEAAIKLARSSYQMMSEQLLPRARQSNENLADRTQAMQSLRDLLTRHIRLEQSIFDAACQAMTAEQREDLDQRYADWRQSTAAALLIAESVLKDPANNSNSP